MALLISGRTPARAESAEQGKMRLVIGEKGANHRIWMAVVSVTNRLGQVSLETNRSYLELATGLNYQKNGKWLESKDEIEILPGGGAAVLQGQHQAYFPGDIYNGLIQMVTPDGQVLKSRPLGLSYDDGSNSVLIAELTNSVGVIVGKNQVVYKNAFTDIKADLRYTYTKGGFEQDIILRQQPPTPESLNLNPATTRLQALTEFFDAPAPRIRSRQLPAQAGLVLPDQTLEFGVMQMTPGRAFLLSPSRTNNEIQVAKNWALLDGRRFLVEEVPVEAVANELADLPLTAMGTGLESPKRLGAPRLTIPVQRLAGGKKQPVMTARAEISEPGFVLDYQTLNLSLTNYTFKGDTTYYISGNVNLYGDAIVEGGAVIKYQTNASIYVAGGLQCESGAYRPAIFTAKDDNTVGATIDGSTGNPIGYYAT